MKPVHPSADVINQLIQWAEQQDAIRAMLLTSTRAVPVPNAPVDDFSDYDVVLFVKDIHPFHEQRSWLEEFGEVLVAYWDPIYPDPDFGLEKFGNVTHYGDGLKIDFTLCSLEMLQKIVQVPSLPAELDAGYRILLDKDDLTVDMKRPTYKAYIPVPPTKELYLTMINDFFSDAPYVAKCLLRGELLPAKWCLDYDMKHVYLRPMLEWLVGLNHNWSLPTGWLGKGLRQKLPAQVWSQLEATYAGADTAENWEALFRTMALFRQVAREVGQGLGYEYPLDLDERVAAFVKDMQPVEANRALYRAKFEAAGRRLGNRFGFYRPAGGFFLWLDVGDGEAVCRRLWREGGLRVLPGGYLSGGADGTNAGSAYIRIALVDDLETVDAALVRLGEVLDDA